MEINVSVSKFQRLNFNRINLKFPLHQKNMIGGIFHFLQYDRFKIQCVVPFYIKIFSFGYKMTLK